MRTLAFASLLQLHAAVALRAWQTSLSGDVRGGWIAEPWGSQQLRGTDEVDPGDGMTPMGITVTGNNRLFTVRDWVWSHQWRDVAYRRFELLGRSLSFDVDFSSVGCGCNAAVYLVQMPDPTTDGSGYCDIQGYDIDGVKPCLEIDLIEGNAKAIQSTLHTQRGHGVDGRTCNQDGCYANLGKEHNQGGAYGPGAAALGGLDSRRPLHVSATFAQSTLSEGLDEPWLGARVDVSLSQEPAPAPAGDGAGGSVEDADDGPVEVAFFDATSCINMWHVHPLMCTWHVHCVCRWPSSTRAPRAARTPPMAPPSGPSPRRTRRSLGRPCARAWCSSSRSGRRRTCRGSTAAAPTGSRRASPSATSTPPASP